jgi:hypothetical protein
MGRGNLLVFFQLFFSIYSGNTKKEEIVHRRVAEDAKRMNIFLSADPG